MEFEALNSIIIIIIINFDQFMATAVVAIIKKLIEMMQFTINFEQMLKIIMIIIVKNFIFNVNYLNLINLYLQYVKFFYYYKDQCYFTRIMLMMMIIIIDLINSIIIITTAKNQQTVKLNLLDFENSKSQEHQIKSLQK